MRAHITLKSRWIRLDFSRKIVLLQVGKQKEGQQEIPDAEASFRGQGILLFLGLPIAEERTKLVHQSFWLFIFPVGRHVSPSYL